MQHAHEVELFVFKLGGWTTHTDKFIYKSLGNTKIHSLSGVRKPLLLWLISTIVQLFAFFINALYRSSLLFSTLAHSKRTFILLLYAWKYYRNNHDMDLIICHNLGSLFPGYVIAKWTGAQLAFDMEDYHPGEAMPTKGTEAEKRRREYLLEKLLPHCAYVSFAADGYEELTRKHITTDIQHPT
ncbi:MAG: hypothetical protein IRZ03_16815, partial [Acidobacterium ailaaui]|nr:hypothetical protein [Pseudacidobacterium ailaaui]